MMDKRLLAALGIVILIIIGVGAFLIFGGEKEDKSVIPLYFINRSSFKLERQYEVVEGQKNLENSLNALFESQGQGDLENLIPVGTKYIDSSFDEETKVLVVNLTGNLLSINYGPEVNYLVIMSIVYTASEASGYSRIKLIFDGQQHDYLNNTLYLGGYFKKDASVLK